MKSAKIEPTEEIFKNPSIFLEVELKFIFSAGIFLRILGIFGIIIGFTIAIWMIIAGPRTVIRILRFGDTKIDDFQHYPARQMTASRSPYLFSNETNKDAVPTHVPVSGTSTDLNEFLRESDTIAFLILKNDRLIFEQYEQGHTASTLSQSFSMAKSFTSILVGKAIADGYIQSVQQPVTDFIPELADNGFSDVTIAHLLTMTSGSSYVENDNPFGIHVILNYTPQLEQKILSFKIKDEPGSIWRYKSGDNVLLGLILQRALAPKTITEYTQETLWTPLGMEFNGLWTLDHTGDGLEKTWCCLSAAARDYLKIGRLYLHEGVWEGMQVVPAEWVGQSTQVGAIPEAAWDSGYRRIGIWNYGYQWWLVSEEEGSCLANGKDGQYLYINPAKDIVILRLGWSTGNLPLSQWLNVFQYLSNNIEEQD
jgi:CubicO group peptidase (beta-lactamase class C family)